MADVEVADAAARPDVLAYPSPTTARYLIFVVALICSGLFVGNWVHNETRGDEWAATMVTCGALDLPATADIDDFAEGGAADIRQKRVNACTRDAERVRAAFIFAGAGLVTVAGLMLFLLTPRVVERRRRLRVLGPKLAGAEVRFDELAEQANVAARVRPRIGPAIQRDAFSYGVPLHNRVALPPALAARWRDEATFDAVVAHELAHVARRDVSLAWLVRSIGYVMVPILLVPIVVGAVSGDVSLVLGYSWRVLVLALVVLVLSNSLLRSREYDADIHAAGQLGGPASIEALLGRTRPRAPTRWSWLTARHPTPEQRIDAVRRPEIVTRVDFGDGLTSGFLTALAVPLLVSAFGTVLATFDRISDAAVVSSVLVGPLLGASVGLALWRAAMIARVAGTRVAVGPVAVGVGLGFAAGQVMSLGQTAVDQGSISHWWALLVGGLAGIGATVLSASIAELWADVTPGIVDVRRGWLIGLGVNAVLFSSVLWAAYQFQTAAEFGGWEAVRWVLVAGLSSPTMTVVVGLLVLAVAVPAARRPWPVVLTGVVSGVVAAGSIMLFRARSGAAAELAEQWERYWTHAWVSAGASVAAAVAMQLFKGRRGAGLGLLAGVVGSMVASAGYLLFNASLGGGWDATFVGDFVRTAVTLGFYGTLLISVLSLAIGPARRRIGGRGSLLPVVAMLVAALTSVALIVGRTAVVPALDLRLSVGFVEPEPAADERTALFNDLRTYLVDVVPDAENRYLAVLSTASQVEDGAFAGNEVEVLRTQVEQPLEDLWNDMSAYRPATRELAKVHADLLGALEHTLRGMAILIAAYEAGTRVSQGPALDEFSEAARLWGDWRRSREDLAEVVLAD